MQRSYYFTYRANDAQKCEGDEEVPARRLAEAMTGSQENSEAKSWNEEYELYNRDNGSIGESHFLAKKCLDPDSNNSRCGNRTE